MQQQHGVINTNLIEKLNAENSALKKQLAEAKTVIAKKDAIIADLIAKKKKTVSKTYFAAMEKCKNKEFEVLEQKLKRSGAGRKGIAKGLEIGQLLPREMGLPEFELTKKKYTVKDKDNREVIKPAMIKCRNCKNSKEFRVNQRRSHKCVPDLSCLSCKGFVVRSAQTMRNHIHKKHGNTKWKTGKSTEWQTEYYQTQEFKDLYNQHVF